MCNTTLNLEKKRVVSSDGEDNSSSLGFTERIRCPAGECSKVAQCKQVNRLPNSRFAEETNLYHHLSIVGTGDAFGPRVGGPRPSLNVSMVVELESKSISSGLMTRFSCRY